MGEEEEEEVGGRIRFAVTAWKLKKEWVGVLDKRKTKEMFVVTGNRKGFPFSY